MNDRPGEVAVIGAGIAYLLALGWSIGNTSYDVWGALIVTPVYGILGWAIANRMFRGSMRPLAIVMSWGLLFKLGGTLGRYWVGFEAYGGGTDAVRYHTYASEAVSKVWAGDASVFTVLPSGSSTQFLERFTAFVYLLTGTSQLAGFITFGFLAFVGTMCFVKAAAIAIPSLAGRRYAWMCVLFPSIAYWPASIGKEAVIFLGLGVATYGIATLFAYGRWTSSVVLAGAGLGLTALVRPHIAGVLTAAALPGLVVALVRGPSAGGGRERKRAVNKFGVVAALVVAVFGLVILASTTVKLLAPANDETATTDSVTQILEETTRVTSKTAGSTFTPPSVSSPTSWPYASLRTLTRPLPFEARGAAQLLSALEMTALVALCLGSWRRLANLPRLLVNNGYVAFAVTALFLGGLAYASFGNLGILTRQKSLLFPFLVLLPCLPSRQWRKPTESSSAKRAVATAQHTRKNETQLTVAAYPARATTTAGVRPAGRADTARGRSVVADDIWA